MIRVRTMSAAILASACLTGWGQDFEPATDAVGRMAVGWNLGNTLDSNSGDVNNMWIERWSGRTPKDYETAWGQPVATKALITMFKEAGFNAIRVPVTWYPHMEATWATVKSTGVWDPVADPIGTRVREDWMKRVREVVDYVISQGMYCILNVHHDTGTSSTHWIIADEANYNQQHERFEALWTQIATEFRDYGERLLFEGYNEMTDVANSWCFASFGASGGYNAAVAASAYSAVNSYAQSFVSAVRATGGNNAQRNLIVNTYAGCSGEGSWNGHLQDPLKQMRLPSDEAEGHLIFEVHAYPSIKGGLSSAKASVTRMMDDLETHLMSKGAPVIIGEWGTANDIKKDANGNSMDDYDVRKADKTAFARDFVEKAKAKGIATFYWMGLSDGTHRTVPEFNQTDLKNAIIKGYYGDGGYSAIHSVTATPVSSPSIFNLQGQQVLSPRKGIYIQGGRKYVMK